jgi:hypothetical protein
MPTAGTAGKIRHGADATVPVDCARQRTLVAGEMGPRFRGDDKEEKE